MRGALLGLQLLLLWPLALLAVIACAPFGRYPWWLITPDDPFALGRPVPHFGAYEPTVRRVYLTLGRMIGDIYWLGLRNQLYGLKHALTPAAYRNLRDVSRLDPRFVVNEGRVARYQAGELALYEVNFSWLPLVMLAGWAVRGVVRDPFTLRQPVHMEFRPIFTIRKRGN